MNAKISWKILSEFDKFTKNVNKQLIVNKISKKKTPKTVFHMENFALYVLSTYNLIKCQQSADCKQTLVKCKQTADCKWNKHEKVIENIFSHRKFCKCKHSADCKQILLLTISNYMGIG